jgi:Flp pilus assembly protein TadG
VTHRLLSRGTRRRPGVASVEFALVLPLFATLLLGLWEIGRMVQVMQVLNNVAREAARQASTATAPLADIKANCLTYIQNAEPSITNTAGYDLKYTNLTNSTVTDPTGATQLDRFTITVTLPFDNVRWLLSSFVIPSGTNLTATVDWYSMRDLPVTVTTGLPVE